MGSGNLGVKKKRNLGAADRLSEDMEMANVLVIKKK